MKSSKKALAFALAAAMVVTAVPVAPAEAASTAKLSAKSVTVAAGTAKKQSKTIKVTTPSTWKSVKVSAKSSATGTAKVSVSGKTVKVTAVKKGTAKVTVTVTAKKSGKKVSKKLTATAKVVNAGLKVTAPTEVVVGSETKLTAKVCPSVAKVTYKSSDDTIATVDENGTVKAVKAGDVTITATSDYGKTVESKIAVKNYVLQSATQKTATTVEAVVLGNTKDLKKSDFVVTNTATKAVVAIDKVEVDSKDATKVTITTFAKMTDGKTYSVALDGVEKEFTATDGKVASLEVTPLQIPSGTAKKIEMVAKDAAGVVVYQAGYNETSSDYSFTIETKTGYTQGNTLYLPKTGDTAIAKVTKHSFKYDTTGKEIETIESGEITITAVDPASVSGFQVRIADDNTKKFDDVKANTQIPVGGNKVAMFKITDANNEEVGNYNYSVSSSDATVMQITGNLSGSAVGTGLNIYGLKEGSAYILVKDNNGNVVASLPITVVAAAKPTTLTLDKTALTVSKATGANEIVSVTATIKDQYGNDYGIGENNVSVECTAKPSAATASTALTGTPSGKTVSFAGSGKEKGSYVFKVTYKEGNNTTTPAYVTVEVKEATGNTDYVLAGSASEIDTKITSKQNATTPVTFDLYQTLGGVKDSKVTTGVKYEVKKDGTTVYKTDATSGNDALISDASGVLTIKVLDVTNSVAKKISTGNYTVIATYSATDASGKKDYTRSATLIVKDTQAGLTVDQKANKAKAATAKSLLSNEKIFEVKNADGTVSIKKVEGACAAKSLAAGSDITSTTFTDKDVVTITKVIADVTIQGVTYEMSANVNYVVTIDANAQY